MKTIKYKTLNGLLSQTRQMTIEQFLNKHFHHNTKGWINFDLDGYIYDMVLERFIAETLLCFNVFILIKGALALVYPARLLIIV